MFFCIYLDYHSEIFHVDWNTPDNSYIGDWLISETRKCGKYSKEREAEIGRQRCSENFEVGNGKQKKKSLSDDTALFNQHRGKLFPNELCKEDYFRRIVWKRIWIREVNAKARFSWCRCNRHRTVDTYWNRVIFSDKCKIDIGSDSRVFIWQNIMVDCMSCRLAQPTTLKFSLMIWGCVIFNSVWWQYKCMKVH